MFKKIFQKQFGSKEIKAILGILDEANYKFNNKAFKEIVKPKIENLVLSNPQKIEQIMKKIPPREWTYGIIANISGDLVESGKYHLYRGWLNPMGPGQDLLKIFDKATEELVKIDNITKEFAEKQKIQLRKNIQNVG